MQRVDKIVRFLTRIAGERAPSGAAYYAFTMVDAAKQPDLAATLAAQLGGAPHVLPHPFTQCDATTMQFSAGAGPPVSSTLICCQLVYTVYI